MVEENRPNPEDLLKQIQKAEARQRRGKLKVFFGASAGVGKTYAMLSEGREEYEAGTDVVVGYAEPHARPETEALLLGMEILPYKRVAYRGTELKEFDLDAALARKPAIVLVDELAHTNAPGLRHAKRWQDIEELLQAGIDVYTTLNVQHLESLNDVVAQVTGVRVRETLPDNFFEQADEIELIDISADDLLERLTEGKVYLPDVAERAMESFFKKSNLTALRELALRATADRVGAQVQSAREEQFVRQVWPTADRVLVCVSPSPSTPKVVRAAKRLASSLRADWMAVYVETPKLREMSEKSKNRLLSYLRLAERLGAETVNLSGHNIAEEVVNYARQRNATKIVVGKPDRPKLLDLVMGSMVDDLIRRSGDIDVYVIRGLASDAPEDEPANPKNKPVEASRKPAFLQATVTVVACTVISSVMYEVWSGFDPATYMMVYLLGVVLVASRYGRGVSAYASFLSVVLLSYFFVQPRMSFAIGNIQYSFTLIVMLGVSWVIGTLTVRQREFADASRERARRTESLYRMVEQLADAHSISGIMTIAVRHLEASFDCKVQILIPDKDGRLHLRAITGLPGNQPKVETGVAQWVFDHKQIAGAGTDTLPASESSYMPLATGNMTLGVLGVQSKQSMELVLAPEQRNLLDAFADQIAMAVQRHQLGDEARRSHVQAETERLRSTLLSTVSNDLTAPLSVIHEASETLLSKPDLDTAQRQEVYETINEESERLGRLVTNLMEATRIESGAVKLKKEVQPIGPIIEAVLDRFDKRLIGRPVDKKLPADLPEVPVDGPLMEHVLGNMLDNALKYSTPGSPIEVAVSHQDNVLRIDLADYGPGIPPGQEKLIFDKFQRGSNAAPGLVGDLKAPGGVGLGLSICKGMVETHGGTLSVMNRMTPGAYGKTGAIFTILLPLSGGADLVAAGTQAHSEPQVVHVVPEERRPRDPSEDSRAFGAPPNEGDQSQEEFHHD